MVTGRRAVIGALMVGGSSLVVGGAALAGDEAPPDVDQQVLDAISALAPPADLADLDEDQGQQIFEQMTGLAAQLSAPVPTDSSELTGPCGGFAFSYDGDGAIIDAAYDAGDEAPPIDVVDGQQAFTKGNPFVLDAGGTVNFYGFAPQQGDGPANHSYRLEVAGIPIADGGDENTTAKNRNAGTIDIGDKLPFPITAEFRVTASMTSDNLPECVGEGHVEIEGNGILDPAGLAGMTLLGVGLIGALFHARPARTWKV